MFVELKQQDVWLWIRGLENLTLLDEVASYQIPGRWFAPSYRKGFWDGRVRFIRAHKTSGTHYIGSGFTSRIVGFLTTHHIPYSLRDERTIEPVLNDACYELPDGNGGILSLKDGKYDYQAAAVDECLLRGRGIVAAATNAGKTEIGSALIKTYDLPTLWLCDRRSLFHQTSERLSVRLEKKVGKIGDGIFDVRDVNVAMVQTAVSHQKEDFVKNARLLISDEIHRMESNTYFSVASSCSAPYRFGLTATPNLTGDGLRLVECCEDVIFRITSEDLITKGVSVPPHIWIVTVNEEKIKSRTKFPEVYNQGVVNSELRTQKTIEVCQRFAKDNKPTLLLVKRLAHGKILEKRLKSLGIRATFVCGATKEQDRKEALLGLRDGKLDVLVGMMSIYSEGIDAGWIKAIVNASASKCGGDANDEAEDGRTLIQLVGRGLRSYPGKTHVDVVDFADTCHKFLSDPSLDRIRTLRSEGYTKYIRRWEDYVP